jgi:hypothetical protein
MPRSSKWFLSIRFPHQMPVCTYLVPHVCHIPRLSLQFSIEIKIINNNK